MTLKKKAGDIAIEILEELLEKNCEPPKTNCGGRTLSKKSEAVALEILEELLEKNWRLLGQLMLVEEERDALKAAMAQPKKPWVGLTDKERDKCMNDYYTARTIAGAIEGKLREKNT